jgi:hypothetical protein
MATRFLIEVPHEATMVACARAVQSLMRSGSHFLTQADWGCRDGEHKAWIIGEMDTKEEARGLVPPEFRSQARVIQLNGFSLQEIEGILSQHKG